MIDWDALERGGSMPSFTAAQKAAATALVAAMPDVKPGKVASLWPLAKQCPDISQLDFGDAVQQNVAIKSLLASSKRLNRQKLLDHIAAGAQPVRVNPFTSEPMLTKTDEGLVIVDGHHRLAAMQLMGAKTVKLWTVPATS